MKIIVLFLFLFSFGIFAKESNWRSFDSTDYFKKNVKVFEHKSIPNFYFYLTKEKGSKDKSVDSATITTDVCEEFKRYAATSKEKQATLQKSGKNSFCQFRNMTKNRIMEQAIFISDIKVKDNKTEYNVNYLTWNGNKEQEQKLMGEIKNFFQTVIPTISEIK